MYVCQAVPAKQVFFGLQEIHNSLRRCHSQERCHEGTLNIVVVLHASVHDT